MKWNKKENVEKEVYEPIQYYIIRKCLICNTLLISKGDYGSTPINPTKHYCGNGDIGWVRLIGFVRLSNIDEFLERNKDSNVEFE